jgi:hypothetical protein
LSTFVVGDASQERTIPLAVGVAVRFDGGAGPTTATAVAADDSLVLYTAVTDTVLSAPWAHGVNVAVSTAGDVVVSTVPSHDTW